MSTTIKVVWNGDTRKFSMQTQNISFENVKNHVKGLWSSAEEESFPNEFHFQYVDLEGDLISILSTLELKEAFSQISNNVPLKLIIVASSKKSTTPSMIDSFIISSTAATTIESSNETKTENQKNENKMGNDNNVQQSNFKQQDQLLIPFEMHEFDENMEEISPNNLPDTEQLLNSWLHLLPAETASQLMALSSQTIEQPQPQPQPQPQSQSQPELVAKVIQQTQQPVISSDSNLFKGVLDPHEKVDVVDYETHYEIEAKYVQEKRNAATYVVQTSSSKDQYSTVAKAGKENYTIVSSEPSYKTQSDSSSYVKSVSDQSNGHFSVSAPTSNANSFVNGVSATEEHCGVDKSTTLSTQKTSVAAHPYCFAY